MLITLYERTNPVSFTQDLTENVILPRNANLRLLSAFCERKAVVSIDGLTDTFYLTANDKTWSGVQVAVPTGDYNAETLMDTIESLANTIVVDNNLQLYLNFRNVPSKNYNAGALVFEAKALSFHYNYPNIVYFNNVPSGKAVWEAQETILNSAVDSINIERRNNSVNPDTLNYLGISSILVGGVETPDIRNCVNFDKEGIDRTWYSSNRNDTDTSRPAMDDAYGMVRYKLQNTSTNELNWWVGLTDTKPDLSALTLANVSDFNNLKGVDIVLYHHGSSVAGTDPDGDVINQNDLLLGKYTFGAWTWEILTGVNENDEIALVLPKTSKGHPKLFISDGSGSAWGKQDIEIFENFQLEDTNYNFCFGSQNPSTNTTNSEQQITELFMTSKQSYTHLDDMGQYIEMGFSQELADKLGLQNTSYKEDKTGTTDKAELEFHNEKDATTKINGTEPPFVSLNINNLPVKSYTPRDTRSGAGYDGLSSSKCVAQLSRFDYNGGYNGHLTDVGNNHPRIELKNAEPIYLSQLEVRLTNTDGSLPQDLAPPFTANIEITEGK